MANRVDASVDRSRPAICHPVLNGTTAYSELDQLAAGHDAVLGVGQPGDRIIGARGPLAFGFGWLPFSPGDGVFGCQLGCGGGTGFGWLPFSPGAGVFGCQLLGSLPHVPTVAGKV
jgi:hypothetical protein